MPAHASDTPENYELDILTRQMRDDAASLRSGVSGNSPRRVHEDLEDYDDAEIAHTQEPLRWAKLRLAGAFFIFGLLNNVLYVIILSAALDLVPASVPKGVVAFFNVFPSLIAKVAWPYLSDGQIRYRRRIYACTLLSWIGMIIIATSSSVTMRLLGIGVASFSSGLGELTFLQFSTTLPTRRLGKTALGAWSSGTGGAGIAGAGLWWLLRGLGVTKGLGLSSVLPLCFPLAFHVVLPPFSRLPRGNDLANYEPIFVADDDASEISIPLEVPTKVDQKALSSRQKIELVKPLLLRYMLWLFLVYVFEYVINSGVAPTLAFDVPTSGLWSRVFKSPRDFYPFWSLTYQTFVFISRSSLSLHIPPLPRRLLPVPAILQSVILVLLSLQASLFLFTSPAFRPSRPTQSTSASWWDTVTDWFTYSASSVASEPTRGSDRAITIVFFLVCLEGLMGGTAYCMTFYHVGREGDDEHDEEKRKVEKAFRIGATGAADSFGILFASLIAMPVEVALCNDQVRAGRDLCKTL